MKILKHEVVEVLAKIKIGKTSGEGNIPRNDKMAIRRWNRLAMAVL